MKRYYKNLAVVLILMLTLSLFPMTAFGAEEDGDEPIVDSVMLSEETSPDEDTDLGLADDILTANESKLVAAADGVLLNPGSTIEAANINSEITGDVYCTPTASTRSDKYHYSINMPKSGMLMITYYSSKDCSITVNGKLADTWYSTDENGIIIRYNFYYFSKADTADMEIEMWYAGNAVVFNATYAPSTVSLSAGKTDKTYILGRPVDSTKVSSFNVKAPYTGYMDIRIKDARNYKTPDYVYYKTSGFKTFETLSPDDFRRFIGVKKGTYKIKVKSTTPLYIVAVKAKKIKQSKYGNKKKNAASLKKKSAKKGLIITNSKKAHWYKLRNQKTQKVTITINDKLSGGGIGGLKVSFYNSRFLISSRTIYPETGSYKLQPYTFGKGKKLEKGTYWIKIESGYGGNGYFTVKWS